MSNTGLEVGYAFQWSDSRAERAAHDGEGRLGRVERDPDDAARQPSCRALKVGLFATGTCGAAALRAAARDPESIDAIVCGAARAELVVGILGRLCAETLLLLGATDLAHLAAARNAQHLAPPGVAELGLIDGGRPMLDAPAEREVVARLTTAWFARAFGQASPRTVKRILADSTPKRHGTEDTLPWRSQ